jgi:SAM-dependent methyltransferase
MTNRLWLKLSLLCISKLKKSVSSAFSKDDGQFLQLLEAWEEAVRLRKKTAPIPSNAPLEHFLYNLANSTHTAGLKSSPELIQAARTLFAAQLPAEARFLVPSLTPRAKPVASTWTFQNEETAWDIKPEDLVLDVGSGGWPFKRANHLADKFPEDTTHRFESFVKDDRPFFEADLEALPFKDKTYDFVFCSHVLEHLDNPGQAIRELNRVAKRGYVEVPTRLSDVMFNFTRLPNHHRWHSLRQGQTLILVEWDQQERRDLGNHFFEALHSGFTNEFQSFFERNRSLFFTSIHWQDRLEFAVMDKNGRIIDSSSRQPE